MFSVLWRLGWFFKEHKARYALAVIVLITVNVVEMLPPLLLGIALDHIQQSTLSWSSLAQSIGYMLGLAVVIYSLNYVWMFQLHGGANRLQLKLRSHLFTHLLKMAPPFFEKYRTGDLMARATQDIKSIGETAGPGILTLVDSCLFSITIMVAMGYVIDWNLTLVTILPLPFIALVITIFGKTIHRRFTIAQDAFGRLNDQVLETISGVRVIRAYVRERANQDKFESMTEDVFAKNVAIARVEVLFEPTIRMLIGLSYLIGLGYGTYLVFRQRISLGELIAFNVYLGMLIWPMFAIGELINVMQRGNASLTRVEEIVSYEPEVQDGKSLEQVALPHTIQFDCVSFRYPSSQADNLSSIALRIDRGQTVGIVGRTGSGKTTLLRQLLREYPIDRGGIAVSGIPIERIPLQTWKQWIGYVPQEQLLFTKTVKENVQFGKEHATEQEIFHALELAAFLQDLYTLPDGVDTLVGERGISLSGGQKQRLALARAIISDPEILLLDDALSAVDAKTEAKIIDHLRAERKGRTTLIATHRLSAVEHSDFILVLDQGQVVERGTHEQLMAGRGWYKEQYESQQMQMNLVK
ncbi:ABC transporter transmembrane domain-containing protein [Paenibacillus sp. MZ04-78.2]|uniref:ABC transporter ATP-binding protein n=1 Tax=Paenibacillus sp. MZ04-78.2 TaxID=2962034 RepID=UPI0020B745CD|nr:ABC transporter transmembrane domain-containing protein [Paenibacillus sp. MZ04-78.2]MCP3774491.1 ABC transporter transmembrane domain-containing protein [Paenibacillus sp. MZ04-78.2]